MAGGDPGLGVHEHAGIDTHDVLVEPGHGFPPVILDVVLELHTILPIIIDCGKAVVNLARREDESVFLAMCHQHLE